jgi:hypothetical protein
LLIQKIVAIAYLPKLFVFNLCMYVGFYEAEQNVMHYVCM